MDTQLTNLAKPLKIDQQCLLRLYDISRVVTAHADQTFAKDKGLTEAEVAALKAGEEVGRLDAYDNRSYAKELTDYNQTKFLIHFSDGSSTESTSFEDIQNALNARSVPVEKFSIDSGKYKFSELDVSIFTDYTFKSAQWSIKGDQAFVRDVNQMLVECFENGEPDFPWLHRKRYQFLITTTLIVILFIFYSYLFRSFIQGENKGVGITASIVCGLSAAIFGNVVGSSIATLFPLVEFEFGKSSKSIARKRSLVYQALSVVIVPTVLSIVISALLD